MIIKKLMKKVINKMRKKEMKKIIKITVLNSKICCLIIFIFSGSKFDLIYKII